VYSNDLTAAIALLPDPLDWEACETNSAGRRRVLCDDLFRLFCALLSYELLFADDSDIFATDTLMGPDSMQLMAASDTRLLIAGLRDALHRWCWTFTSATGGISVVQRLLVGLVDKPASGAGLDDGSCAGQLLYTFRCLWDQEGSHLQPPDLAVYGKVHAVVKLFNQLHDRYCRFSRRESTSLGMYETLWLWPNTYLEGDSGTVVVSPVLSVPLNLTADSLVSDLRHLNASDAGGGADDDSDLVAYSAGYGPLIGLAGANSEGVIASATKVSFAAACLLKAILIMLPQVIPFQRRVSIFECLLKHDRVAQMRSRGSSGNRALDLMMSMMDDHSFHSGPGISLRVRRSHVMEDSFAGIEHNPANRSRMKNRMQVEFVSEDGHMEAGIDGGGLFKEFIDLFLKTAFDPQSRLFLPTSEQWLVSSRLRVLPSRKCFAL
jgi:hypothetical protein